MLTIAFVGCAHIHTPGFAKSVAARRSSVMEAMYKGAKTRRWVKPR
ncbi:MAG: hypothetical protein IMZ66_00695 [Planctomycetes bacterium]|nr:hypothetical protein [Planctomycetota bacterium]